MVSGLEDLVEHPLANPLNYEGRNFLGFRSFVRALAGAWKSMQNFPRTSTRSATSCPENRIQSSNIAYLFVDSEPPAGLQSPPACHQRRVVRSFLRYLQLDWPQVRPQDERARQPVPERSGTFPELTFN